VTYRSKNIIRSINEYCSLYFCKHFVNVTRINLYDILLLHLDLVVQISIKFKSRLNLKCKLCSCVVYVISVCLRIVLAYTYCVVFLFCLSSSWVPYVVNFSGLFILIAPSVLSNVYFMHISTNFKCQFNFNSYLNSIKVCTTQFSWILLHRNLKKSNHQLNWGKCTFALIQISERFTEHCETDQRCCITHQLND
jgi:hypothetical protein